MSNAIEEKTKKNQELIEQTKSFFSQNLKFAETASFCDEVLLLNNAIGIYSRRALTKGDIYVELRLKFESAKKFYRMYKFLVDYIKENHHNIQKDDPIYKAGLHVVKIARFMKECDKAARNNISYELSDEQYKLPSENSDEIIKKASEAIRKYVDSPLIRLNDFLKENTITEKEFYDYTVIVLTYNKELFEKYNEKARSNELYDILILPSNNHYKLSAENSDEIIKKASEAIRKYVDYPLIRLNDFLKENAITEKEFRDYRVIVLTYNKELFERYEEKERKNREERISEMRGKYSELGRIASPKRFISAYLRDIIFLTNFPHITEEIFSDLNLLNRSTVRKNAIEVCNYLLRDEPQETIQSIRNLFLRNAGVRGTYTLNPEITKLSVFKAKKSEYIFNGSSLNDEDKNIIANYIEKNDIIPYTRTLNLISRAYLRHSIEIKDKELKILPPMLNKKPSLRQEYKPKQKILLRKSQIKGINKEESENE